jgi:hypothetical protein
MRGFKPDDQRQPQGGNMGRDAVMAAIARQNQQQTAPQAEPPKPESSPMQSLRQIFSGTVFDPRSRQDKREREAGLADGGRVRPRGFVAGPGTGTSDSIKARLSDGEYVLPADTVAAVGVDALDALKDATHTPVAKPDKNRAGEPLFANAGLVDDERKRNSFGDAAAAANDYGVQQVMGQATQMTAAPAVRAAIGQQMDAPARIQAAVNQIPTGISGQRAPVPVASTVSPPVATAPAVETDHQAGAPSAAPVRVQRQRDVRGAEFAEQQRAAAANRASWSADYDRAGAQMAADAREAAARRIGNAIMRPASSPATPIHPVGFVPGDADMPARDVGKVDFAQSSVAAAPGQQPGVANAAPVAPARGADINTTDRSGDANMPAMDTGARGLALPAANDQSKPQQVAPGIYRQGNSFGDSPEAASWGARGSKNPNANDLAAADALANRSAQEVSAMAARLQQPTAAGFQPMQAPQVEHSGNSWARRNELRNAQVSASSMTEQPGYGGIVTRRGVVGGQQGGGPASQQYAALLAQDMKARGLEPELAGKAMQENAGLQREGMREQGLNTRSAAELAARGFDAQARRGLDERRLALDEKVKGAEVRAAGRQEKLFEQYANAKTDEERARIAKTIRDLSGKDSGSEWAVQVTPATKNPDGSTSEASIYRYNKRTGDVQRVDGQASAPSANHVAALRKDPSLAAQFDETYGAGAAKRVLGK